MLVMMSLNFSLRGTIRTEIANLDSLNSVMPSFLLTPIMHLWLTEEDLAILECLVTTEMNASVHQLDLT